jgi:cation diffusion facilitator CzcD-associated flavoprotein CzcO
MPGESDHAFKADGGIASYPILIIGAGISGIAAGCQVKRTLGVKDFVIFDKNNDIGVSILLS